MKAVKRWRYYCDHCKKAGASPYHMRNHEESCTLNPARVCKLCARLNGGNGTPLPEMLALLPDPAQHMRAIPAEDLGWDLGEIPARASLRPCGRRAFPCQS
jgi:hypothetical protein